MKNTNTIYGSKFFYVSFKSADGVSKKELYMGVCPKDAIMSAKACNLGCNSFKAGKTAYNTLGEKF